MNFRYILQFFEGLYRVGCVVNSFLVAKTYYGVKESENAILLDDFLRDCGDTMT
jgi:hypothetical protein